MSTKLLAIDPVGCGCTECMTGEYRPLQDATQDEILSLIKGEVMDNTQSFWDIDFTWGYDEIYVSSIAGSFTFSRSDFEPSDVVLGCKMSVNWQDGEMTDRLRDKGAVDYPHLWQ